MLAVTIAWVLFRSPTIHVAVEYLSGIFSTSLFVLPTKFLSMLPWIAVLLVFEFFMRRHEHALDVSRWPGAIRGITYLFLCVVCIAYQQRNGAFIYFQF